MLVKVAEKMIIIDYFRVPNICKVMVKKISSQILSKLPLENVPYFNTTSSSNQSFLPETE